MPLSSGTGFVGIQGVYADVTEVSRWVKLWDMSKLGMMGDEKPDMGGDKQYLIEDKGKVEMLGFRHFVNTNPLSLD